MKLYETAYTAAGGLAPIKIRGRTYNAYTADLVSADPSQIREVYRKRSGEYFLHLMVPGIGHYIAPLTEAEAAMIEALNQAGGEEAE